MEITDLSATQNKVQRLEILSDNEAIGILGGNRNGEPKPQNHRGRNGSSNGCIGGIIPGASALLNKYF